MKSTFGKWITRLCACGGVRSGHLGGELELDPGVVVPKGYCAVLVTLIEKAPERARESLSVQPKLGIHLDEPGCYRRPKSIKD